MKNIIYKRKLNNDGTPFLDENGDFVNEIVSEEEVEVTHLTHAEKYASDKDFGIKLMDLFLIDNRESPIAFNPAISDALLQKMQLPKAFAEVGDIKTVKYLLSITETDEIFTQQRKDKYVLMCNNHLGL